MTEHEDESAPGDRRVSHMVRMLAEGRHAQLDRLTEIYGEDCLASAKMIWATLDTAQTEVRAVATATIYELCTGGDDPHLRLSAGKELLVAADRRELVRRRYDDLSDATTRAAALAELRTPSDALQRIILEAWERPAPGVLRILNSLLVVPHPLIREMLSELGYERRV